MSEPTPDSITVQLSPGQVDVPGILATPGILAKLSELAAKMNAPSAEQPLRGPGARGHVCHRCQAPATQQWPRHATPDEAEDWHAAREQHIRAHNDGRPETEYVSDRTDTVTVAVHGCDEHVVDEPHRTHDADCGGHGACQCGESK